MLSLLIPAFSLLLRPHVLPVMLRPTTECSSTTEMYLIKYLFRFVSFSFSNLLKFFFAKFEALTFSTLDT